MNKSINLNLKRLIIFGSIVTIVLVIIMSCQVPGFTDKSTSKKDSTKKIEAIADTENKIEANINYSTGTNAALNKTVTCQSYQSGHPASHGNDSNISTYWSADPYPQWWKVDFGALYDINEINIVNYPSSSRYYKYAIYASPDDSTWIQIADKQNTNPATSAGDTYSVTANGMRYIRVNMTYNSANKGVHIKDFKAYGVPSGGDTTPPTVPQNLSSPSQTSSSINLTWQASTDNIGVTGYRIYRNSTEAGTSATTSFTDTGLSANTTYSYYVKAYDAANNLSDASNPINVTTQEGGGSGISSYNYYYGSFHNHSNYSDGEGSPTEAYTYARDTAQMDFLGLSEHGESLTSSEWSTLDSLCTTFTQNGVFIALRGFEWTHWTYGHACILNTSDYCSSSSSSTDTFTELVSWLNSRSQAIATFNHPGRNDSTGNEFNHFSTTPSAKFIALELFGDNGFFDEYYYNDGYYSSDGNKGYLDEAISRGWKIGAGGGHDEHEGTWGTGSNYRLCILAESLTKTNLFDGLTSRRFFTTADKNLKLYFDINGSVMGSTISNGTYSAKIQALDGNGESFTKIELLKNGTVINTWNINTTAPDVTYTVTGASGDYFYLRIKQADNNEAISSPIWIQ